MSSSLIGYVLKAAIRDKLFIAMLALIVATVSMSFFMASSAITEQDQFLTVYASGSLRMLSVLGLVVFTVFFVRRSFDNKDVEFLLSRPISRIEFILSYSAAFSLLALIMSCFCGAAVFLMNPDLPTDAISLWALSIAIELIITTNIAFFFSMALSSASTAVLGVLGFYTLARMMGQILGILEAGTAGPIADGMAVAMKMVSSVTPRLDLMGQTSWLVYGVSENIGFTFIIAQGLLFLSIVIVAALIDLVMRQF